MKDYKMDGWIDIDQISIPPIGKKGFKENIIIRKAVEVVTLTPYQEIDECKEEETVGLRYYEEETVHTEKIKGIVERKEIDKLIIERVKTGEKIQVSCSDFIIGRGKSANYILLGNPTISRHHIRIIIENDGYYMEDLHSENHTFINGEKLTQRIKMRNGMVFVLSDEKFRVWIEPVNKYR